MNTEYKQRLVTVLHFHSYLTQEFCPKNNVPFQFVFLVFHRLSQCHNSVEFDMLAKMSADPLKRRESQHEYCSAMSLHNLCQSDIEISIILACVHR